MAFCSNCGAEVQGKFCAKCGTPLSPQSASAGNPAPDSGGAAPPPPYQAPPQASYAPPPPQVPPGQAGYAPPPPNYAAAPQSAGMEENVAAALCYLLGWITGVLFLVLAPYNQNRVIRFHAFQSIFMCVAMIVLSIALFIFSAVLAFIPYVGAIASLLIYAGVWLGVLIMWIMLMYKAYNRERLVLPIVGPLAEKQA